MVGPASQSLERDAPGDLPSIPARRGRRVGVRMRTASLAQRVAVVTVGTAGALLVVAAVFTFVERRLYAGRVLPGVEIDGVSTSGLHEVSVYDEVARLGVKLAQSPVRVRIGSRELSAGPSILGLTVDARATARAAFGHGRHGSLTDQLFGTAVRWVRPDRLPLRVAYDENRLEGMLDGWSAETDNGAVEGDLRFEGAKVVPIVPHAGTGILRAPARAALVRMLASAHRPVLTLPVGTINPRVDAAAVASAAARARSLLRGDITLVTGRAPLRVTPTQLAGALGTTIVGPRLNVTLDGARLHAALGPALARLESPSVDASFEVTADNTVHVVPSRVGHEIDMRAVARAILRGDRRIQAPLREVSPRRDTKWAESLGIMRQVSSFTTEYPPDQTRVLNIHRGADLLNNTIVEPGRVFSLNDTIGPRTKERGFVTAPVFAQGEFFDDYGGGVSQLATTTYNAAFFGGYQDVTHQPHTIYISRYPAGREATVNYGSIDLQFRDDTPHGILIRTFYDDTSVTVALYGDTDGRTVGEENRTTSNPVPVTDELIQCPASSTVDPHDVCSTLSVGETAQISTGDEGFDVALDRVIDQPGTPQRREHYTWHYTMLPNQILVGSNPAAPTTSSAPTTSTPPASTKPPPAPTTAPTSTNAAP